MLRRFTPDLRILLLLALPPLLLFWQQTLGGRTLLPADNLYQYEPWAGMREQVGAPAVPHNALVSDLVLQNYPWKQFLRQSLDAGEAPLWNPQQFSGIPFLAAGQHSALYPFSLIFHLLPLWLAYGWFTVTQLWLAGAGMYLLLRGLQVGRFGGVVAALAWQLSAFLVISAVFPMILAAAAWLPLLLLLVELTIRAQPLAGRPARAPWTALGALALGCVLLAGHAELSYYTLLITGVWALARLLQRWQADGPRPALRALPWLLALAAIGLATGALQLVPLYEFAGMNFRSGAASYEQVVAWAHPPRDLVQFLLPNFYGSPAQHSVFDFFSGQQLPLRSTEWGIKNYVEAALYSGILTLACALLALGNLRRRACRRSGARDDLVLPAADPGRAELHVRSADVPSAVAAAGHRPAAFALPLGLRREPRPGSAGGLRRGPAGARRCGAAAQTLWPGADRSLGLATLAALLVIRLFYPQLEPLAERVFHGLAQADQVFADARMFTSFQFGNLLTFALMTGGAGLILLWAGRNLRARGWQVGAVALLALDLMLASGGFHAAADPALLEVTPPAIAWLQSQPGAWRFTTLEADQAILPANSGWVYGLRDIRGYESIIPRQYVDFMQRIAPQRQLPYNRVAPLYIDKLAEVDWQRLALTGTRWLVTSAALEPEPFLPPGSALAWEDDALRIYELPAYPLAWLTTGAGPLQAESLPERRCRSSCCARAAARSCCSSRCPPRRRVSWWSARPGCRAGAHGCDRPTRSRIPSSRCQ